MAVTSTIENPAFQGAKKRSASWTRLTRSDRLWALAFATPYILVFGFRHLPDLLWPVARQHPASYRQLLADPVYPSALFNTVIYLAVAVNLKLFLALLLSGFFMRKGWWTKISLLVFILPGRSLPSPAISRSIGC